MCDMTCVILCHCSCVRHVFIMTPTCDTSHRILQCPPLKVNGLDVMLYFWDDRMARTSVAGGLVQRRGLVIPSYSVLDVLGEVDFARTRFVHILFKNMFNLFNVF